MHIHVRIHRWVLWWFNVGIVLGAIAVINILFRDLSRTQERIILIIGALNWLLGGLICYGYGGVRIVRPTGWPTLVIAGPQPGKGCRRRNGILLPTLCSRAIARAFCCRSIERAHYFRSCVLTEPGGSPLFLQA